MESGSFLIKSCLPAHTHTHTDFSVGRPCQPFHIISSSCSSISISAASPTRRPDKGPWKWIAPGSKQRQSKNDPNASGYPMQPEIRCWDSKLTLASCCWLAADKLQQSMQGSWEYVNFGYLFLATPYMWAPNVTLLSGSSGSCSYLNFFSHLTWPFFLWPVRNVLIMRVFLYHFPFRTNLVSWPKWSYQWYRSVELIIILCWKLKRDTSLRSC